MKQLPPSWGTPTLLECSQFVRGVTYTKSDAVDQTASGFLPIIRANNIQARRFEFNDLVYVPANLVSAEQLLKVGDVVVATSSGSISVVGKAAQVRKEQPMSFGAFCGVLRPSPVIHARYFGHFFSSKAYRDAVSDMARGVNINNLKRDHFQAIRIPLAPLVEQERIADKLDTVLTRVDAVNIRLTRVTPLLKRFRQSVLAAATSGRLVGAVKQDVSKVIPVVLNDSQRGLLPDSWSWRPIIQLARLESGHTPRKSVPEYWDGGSVPWLSLQDIRAADGRIISETKLKPTMLGIENSSARLLPAGTVCFCRDISFGYVTITGREMATSQHFVNWVCGAELNPRYLMFALMAARDSLSMSGQGTTVTTMYMPALKVLQLATPPIEIQAEIVRRVETLFAFADRLEARLQAAQTAADRLTPSLLAKAFRGELVPQDPNDEPAAQLLQRLVTQNASAPQRKRRATSAT